MSAGNDWSEQDEAQLRKFWADNVSTNEIGRRMGRSKNSVVGKAHRINLPERPSPIKRLAPGEQRKPRQVHRKLTLPPLKSVPSVPPLPDLPVVAPLPSPPKPVFVAPVRRPAPPINLDLPIVDCMWVTKESRGALKPAAFCSQPSEPGKPYCPDHCRVAYVRLRRERLEASAA